jgi:hypothetical protein
LLLMTGLRTRRVGGARNAARRHRHIEEGCGVLKIIVVPNIPPSLCLLDFNVELRRHHLHARCWLPLLSV